MTKERGTMRLGVHSAVLNMVADFQESSELVDTDVSW